MSDKNKRGIKYFAFYVNHLIDQGVKEDIDLIEQKMEENQLVEYIGQKYKQHVDFTPFGVDGPYSIADVNERFSNFVDYVRGNESRKFVVSNNGLNLIIALCLEMLDD